MKKKTINRIQLINFLIKERGYKSYLEIGVQKGLTFNEILIEDKLWVDPAPEISRKENNYKFGKIMTSDAFFAEIDSNKKWDIVFVDGLHHSDQVMKDVENSLNHLLEGGIIILHDCNPLKEAYQTIPRKTKTWYGDCWKAAVRLRATRDDLKVFVLKADAGLGIVERGKSELLQLDKPLDEICYSDLNNDRENLLGLVNADEWISSQKSLT